MHNDSNDYDWVLLTRYLSGDLSPAEREAAERWLHADPRHCAALEELRAVWQTAGGDTSGWDPEKGIAGLRARIEKSGRMNATSPVKPPEMLLPFSTPPRRPWLPIAAGIAAVLAGVAVFRLPAREAVTPPVAAAPIQTEIRTERGEQKEVKLPDGTRVVLAAATSLRYDTDFNVRHRNVELDGEAYFEAVHEGAGPLEVRTDNGVARDIGTAFVVSAYATLPTQVVVTEGAVVLRGNGAPSENRDSILLQPRQLGRVLPDGALEFVRRVDPDNYIAWTRGQLAFADAPLTDVARELRRWYDADVRVANSRVGQRRFTGSFTRGELENAVQLIAAVADVSVRRSGAAWIFE